MLGNFVLPTACQLENYKNLHSQNNILHFLILRRLTAILLLGGLGFKNQQNNKREVRILPCVISS